MLHQSPVARAVPAGDHRLSGKVAFVTGGLRGIGRACVERFLAEGAAVVVSDLAAADSDIVAEFVGERGPALGYVQADVRSEEDWAVALDQVSSRHGKLHILVNNAGVDMTGPLQEIGLADWQRVLDINATGVFLGLRTFRDSLACGGADFLGGSSVINMSSIMGIVGHDEAAGYCASKGAVRMFTKAAAIEFAAKRLPIRVNSVHPGCIHTPLLAAGFDNWIAKGFARSQTELVVMMEEQTPAGRLGDPAEVAGAAFFLASEDSSYVTGAELVVDGGWTAR